MERLFAGYRVFSHDVMAAILVSQNNETAAMLVSQTSPLGVELFLMQTLSFVPINLHRFWPREWKHSKIKHSNRELGQRRCMYRIECDHGSGKTCANEHAHCSRYLNKLKDTASCNRFFSRSLSMHLFAKSTISNYHLKWVDLVLTPVVNFNKAL